MRKIFKNLFSILTIFSLLFVFSCTEDENKVETNINHGLTHKKIPLKEIAKNKKLFEKLGKLNENKITTKNINGKIVYSNEYGFYVDTDYANYIEDENGKHSYVFSVYRDSVENKLDNIVFSSQEDNTYKVVLISYDLTQEEQDNLEKGILINVFDNPRTVYIVENENLSNDIFSKMIMITSDSGCITLIQTSCSYGNHQDGMIAGFNCPGYIETQTWTNCDTGGGYYTPSGNTSGSTSTGTNGSYPSGGNGGNSSSNNNNPNPIYTTPTFPSKEQILKNKFLKQLTKNFLDPNNQNQCLNSLPQEQKEEILDAVGSLANQIDVNGNVVNSCGNNSTVDEQFNEIEGLMAAMCGNPNMDFDIAKSLKSPANIDFSAIDTSTSEGDKLNCIFNKLAYSCSFENLFINTFGVNNKINVKFEIVDNFPDPTTLGNCQMTTVTNSSGTTYSNVINIKRSLLQENNGLGNASNIKIAKVILHELMHAYLNIKLKNCNQGVSLPYINNLELGELIKVFYENFNCELDYNGSPQSQHSFMFDQLIPSFQTIFQETRDLLISSSHIQQANNIIYTDASLNISENFNWNNFYKYIMLNGLHQCQSFNFVVTNNSTETFLYSAYSTEINSFTKTCQ